jgi:hypothetical protein
MTLPARLEVRPALASQGCSDRGRRGGLTNLIIHVYVEGTYLDHWRREMPAPEWNRRPNQAHRPHHTVATRVSKPLAFANWV